MYFRWNPYGKDKDLGEILMERLLEKVTAKLTLE